MSFNRTWARRTAGCLTVLRSRDIATAARRDRRDRRQLVVLVRSDASWHGRVTRVAEGCRRSRRRLKRDLLSDGCRQHDVAAGRTPHHSTATTRRTTGMTARRLRKRPRAARTPARPAAFERRWKSPAARHLLPARERVLPRDAFAPPPPHRVASLLRKEARPPSALDRSAEGDRRASAVRHSSYCSNEPMLPVSQ